MQNKEIKNLDFDLDNEELKTNEKTLDLLLESKKQNNQKDSSTKLIQISPDELAKTAIHLKKKNAKSKRLQTYITEELYQAIQQYKKQINSKKDSETVEALLRLALGMKQI